MADRSASALGHRHGGSGVDWRRATRMLGVAAPLGGVAVLAGLLAAEQAALAAALTLAVVAGVAALCSSLTAALLAFPATVLVFRLGLGGTGMSVADVALVIALMVVAPLAPWANPGLRRLLGALALYGGLLAVAVVANPTTAAAFEWAHRLVLVGGSVLVGATVAAHGKVHTALRLYLGAMVVLAAAAVATAATEFAAGELRPAFPLGIHKNAAGSLLAVGIVVLAFPHVAQLRHRTASVMRVLLVVGLLATQSKGAMVGLAVAALAAVPARRARLLSPAMLAGLIAMAAVVTLSVSQQLANPSDKYNGINSRVTVYDQAWKEFRSSQVFGVGVRYFKTEARAQGEPHNVVYVTLAESGAIGLTALALLLGTFAAELRAMSSDVALLALLALLLYVVQSVAAIFWVAGPGTIPWLLVGLAVGSEIRARTPMAGSASHAG